MSDAPLPSTLKIQSWPLQGLPKGFLDPKWMPGASKLAGLDSSAFLLSPEIRKLLVSNPPTALGTYAFPPATPSTPVKAEHPKPVVLPVHKLVLGGSTPSVFTHGMFVESLRSVCALIAEQCGRSAKVVNGVIWLSFDSKRLYDHLDDPTISKATRAIQTTELLSSAISVLAAATGAHALEKASVGVHFVAKFGENVHKGTLTVNQSDLMLLNPERDSATAAEMLKLGEVFIPAG